MLGFSSSFVIFLFIAFIFGYELGWRAGVSIIVIYAIFRIIWKFFTD